MASQRVRPASAAPLHCTNHPATTTTLRCDRCGRPFCSDCVVTRFITSRSSVWLCRRCAGVQTAARYNFPAGGGLIRHPRDAVTGISRSWLMAAGLVALALVTALHQGLIR